MTDKTLNMIQWVLVAMVAFIFLQSLPFKFSGHEQTQLIFSTIGNWLSSIGLSESLAQGFTHYGGFIIGSLELIATILLVIPKSRMWGALLGLGLMTGAIFFHLFTPLGVARVIDDAGNTDNGVLFIMACIAFLSNALLIYLNRSKP